MACPALPGRPHSYGTLTFFLLFHVFKVFCILQLFVWPGEWGESDPRTWTRLPSLSPLRTVYSSVTLVEGKDPTSCSSYRPISLLNLDLKIFTRILANRLTTHIQGLVHLDQVGFIPHREAPDNTIKVLNLIHAATKNRTTCVFLGTDAEKAFDRVDWQFLFTVWENKCYSGSCRSTLALQPR